MKKRCPVTLKVIGKGEIKKENHVKNITHLFACLPELLFMG